MFTKLLKQDYKATWRLLGLACLTAVILGIVCGCSLRYLNTVPDSEEFDLPILLCALTMLATIVFFAICGAGSLLVCLVRFYRSRFTDEGYLTFTLPVTTHQILLSSLINIATSVFVVGVVITLSAVLMILIGVSNIEEAQRMLSEFFRESLPQFWKELAEGISFTGWIRIVIGLVHLLIGEVVIAMLAITIGALSARKHKVLMAIVFYYAIHLLLDIVSGTALFRVMNTDMNVNIMGWMVVLGAVAVDVAGYLLMHYLADRKLNLP